jgi:hypothetical protein
VLAGAGGVRQPQAGRPPFARAELLMSRWT